MPTNNENSAQPLTFYNSIHSVELSPTKEEWNIWNESLDIHFCEINC